MRKVSLKSLTPALLNKSLFYPEQVYDEYTDLYHRKDIELFEQYDIHYEILSIPTGLLGIEFIKTHIFFTPYNDKSISTIVQCIHGIVTIILQKNKPREQFDIETSVEEGYVISLRKGEQIVIPTGYFYTFINTTGRTVIIARIFKQQGIVDYTLLKHEQGLAYFAIRKNARTEIVFNPRYKHIPKVKKIRPNHELIKFVFGKSPLYEITKKNIKQISILLA